MHHTIVPEIQSLQGIIELHPKALQEYHTYHKTHYGEDLSGDKLETEAKEAMMLVLISAGVPVFD